MSVELRGKYWHVRYRIDGKSKCESSHSADRAVAEAIDRKRQQEILERQCIRRSTAILNTHRPINGCVYFFLNPSTGFVKIGYSAKVSTRIKNIEVHAGIQIEPLAVVRCTNFRTVEQFLHRKYCRFQVQGEWFQFSGLDLARAIGDALRVAI